MVLNTTSIFTQQPELTDNGSMNVNVGTGLLNVATIAVTGTFVNVDTTSYASMLDGNSTTYYAIDAGAGTDRTYTMTIDFQKLMTNLIFYSYYSVVNASSGQAITAQWDYSEDGSTWTSFGTDISYTSVGENFDNLSHAIPRCRYIRLTGANQTNPNAAARIYVLMINGVQ